MLLKLEIHKQKNIAGPHLQPNTKINSKWIEDLNIGPRTIKLLEENRGKHHDIAFGNDFFDMAPKAKTDKWDSVRLKNSVHQKKPSIGRKSNLNGKAKTLKIFKENIGIGSGFLDMMSKHSQQRKKLINWTSSKFKFSDLQRTSRK